jgi:hypothetical protein
LFLLSSAQIKKPSYTQQTTSAPPHEERYWQSLESSPTKEATFGRHVVDNQNEVEEEGEDAEALGHPERAGQEETLLHSAVTYGHLLRVGLPFNFNPVRPREYKKRRKKKGEKWSQ